ncbi:hypothetical protein [Pigmentiphaga sp.]|mgnify:CR=1 FL=1|jgi:hypothetical protein|uniref:hypothetical protein n=1 Tax=Pigmentiphaga sp. TaxID=1977564 RepID=UPI0025EDB052|nr:hypothetical protein [Pigmentiphaga sp.]MBX6318235.1 hypothetical protein [Pigmentiphaga sp.]
MKSESTFFEWLGSALGEVIRTIVAALKSVFGGFGEAVGEFSSGLADALGMSPTLFNFALLVLGMLLLYAGIRALLSRSILGALFWFFLAALLLGGLIGENGVST